MHYDTVEKHNPANTLRFWNSNVLGESFILAFIAATAISGIFHYAVGQFFFTVLLHFTITSISTFVIAANQYADIKEKAYTEWKKRYVIPYIQFLPKQEVEKLIDFRIYRDFDEFYASVTFIHNEELRNENADIKLVEEIKEPYLTFRINDREFKDENGRITFYKDRIYATMLHLPKDFNLKEKLNA